VVPLVPLLSVLDHLVLSRAVSARWVGPDEGGPRRRVYRVTDGEAVAC
jgi:DNA-binding PadR family transcriptional regulator